jgi:acyl dehydratase
MAELLCYDELRVGDRWISPERIVTEDDVIQFAELTGDHDRLHTDEEFASNTPFGRPIAHGLLGLSLMAGLSSNCPAMDTVAFVGVTNWTFLQPVFFGDSVHVVTEVVELRPHGRKRGRVTWKRSLVNQNGKITQEGHLETLVSCRAGSMQTVKTAKLKAAS